MILICDDDRAVCSSLGLVLKRAGYGSEAVYSPREAVEFVRAVEPELILLDMNYTKQTSGEEGLTLLKQIKLFRPNTPVILITAWGSISLAVSGIQAGAFDFVTKPWNNLMLLNTIRTALELQKEEESPRLAQEFYDYKIVGKSPLIQKVLNSISRIAKTNASVLITGESGTGKELVAEAIHRNSQRREAPFVKVNLGGISQSLFESEMFGHKKGAFTDAQTDRVGRFEMANRGTIFLDEIGDLDGMSQVKMLRVLQDQTFEPLGDSKTKQVDVRVVSATNRNLVEMIAKGTFREDLFYRINLITIRMPSLRERSEDIPLLVKHFADNLSSSTGAEPVEVSAEAIDFLATLPYPGNVRELKNLVERVILVSNKRVLTVKDFKDQYTEMPGVAGISDAVLNLDQMEKAMILRAVELYGDNHSKIATALGITRQALYRRLEKYGINLNK